MSAALEEHATQETTRYTGAILAVISVLLCMVLPMVVIRRMAIVPAQGLEEVNVGATVALGALLRTSGRTMLRSTVMGAARTMTRALTRRIMRSFLPMMMRLFLPALRSSMEEGGGHRRQSLWYALSLGMLTLGLSFYGVVELSNNEDLLGGLSPMEMSVMAAVPLLLHYNLFYWIGRQVGVEVELRTDIDGIFLQGYFTGALSYLPLASDIELKGSVRSRGICASGVLFGFLLSYALVSILGDSLGSTVLQGLAAQLLLYAFVLSFPLPPLDGSDVWVHSRWGWLALWLAILMTFLGRMPEAFYEIL